MRSALAVLLAFSLPASGGAQLRAPGPPLRAPGPLAPAAVPALPALAAPGPALKPLQLPALRTLSKDARQGLRGGTDFGRRTFDRASRALPALQAPSAPALAPLRAVSSPSPRPVELAGPRAAPRRASGLWPRLRNAAAGAVAALLLAAGCEPYEPPPPPDFSDVPGSTWYLTYPNGHPILAEATHFRQSELELELLEEIDLYRSELGLGPIRRAWELDDLARAHSIHMDVHRFTSNANPEGDDDWTRSQRAGLWVYAYEESSVTGLYAYTGWDAFQYLMNDPAFRRQVEDPFYNAVGIGVHAHPDSDRGYYWTVGFGEF